MQAKYERTANKKSPMILFASIGPAGSSETFISKNGEVVYIRSSRAGKTTKYLLMHPERAISYAESLVRVGLILKNIQHQNPLYLIRCQAG